jgi:hypothetical protein
MIKVLGIGLPPAKTEKREEEYAIALQKNIECEQIERVMVVVEETGIDRIGRKRRELLDNPKVLFRRSGVRATWAAMAALVNSHAPTGIVGLCNADVWFDKSVEKLLKWDGSWDNLFISLSRETWTNLGSADAWLYRDRLPISNVDEFLGVQAIDNRVIAMARKAGYLVLDPCLDVILHHEHDSREHTPLWDTRIPPPWAYAYMLTLT